MTEHKLGDKGTGNFRKRQCEKIEFFNNKIVEPQKLKFRKDTKTSNWRGARFMKRGLSRSQEERERKPETGGKSVDFTT